MKPVEQFSPVRYYETAAAVIERYRTLGPIVATGEDSDAPLAQGPGALAHAVTGGARWLSWGAGPGVPGCLRVSAGAGADIATSATAALAIIEELELAGILVVPAVENATALLLYLGPDTHQLTSLAALATRAPEIATIDPDVSEGRALLVELTPGTPIPLPYSLVDGAEGTTAVMPVTVDEIAAMTAGMPVDPSPGSVLERLTSEGDLAAALLFGVLPQGAAT